MRLFAVCLVVAAILWPDLAISSAPADFEADCINDPDNPVPPGHRRIFDTYSYEELFDRRNPILETLNTDGGSGWIAGSGGSCREQLRICDYLQATQPQNNWVFTQFINYLEATEVFVNVTYQYISCVNNARRGCSTLHTTMYVYEPEDSSSIIERVNPANYESNPVAVLGIDEGEGRGEKLFTFKPSSNANGFYLGIEDTGTCGSIERVTVYYRIIPNRTDGLIEYPEIPLPPVGSSDTITRSAVCAADSTGSGLELTADSRGIVEGDPSCLCNPGYQFESLAGGGAECAACRPGQYKPSLSNDISCLACPPNSASADPATAVCSCDVTFFRPPNEPDEPCTRPPSSPRLAINSPPIINGADITVCWLPSNDRGGRDDFHYNIYRLAAESGQFLIINTEDILPNDENQVIENQNEPVCYTLTGLEEQSSFTIVVVASNGAANDADSFTDVSEVENRFIAFYVATGSSTVCPGVVNERCDVNNGACEQTCTDTATSVQCSCNTGYELDSDGRSCNDINECDTNNGGCEQKCTNIPGSRVCSCDPGFFPVGTTCQDINECSVNNGGCGELICSNTPGSFECGCRPGSVVATDGTNCIALLTVSISVEYDPPADFTPGPNEYRAASGPVAVTCTATGTGTGAVSYQWSSTCRDCPFQSATTSSVRRAAVHSGDTGTHTCTATQDGTTASASIDFHVVDAGMQLFRGSPRGNLPNNGLAIFDDPASGFRLRLFCRSDSMTPNVGQFIGLDGTAITSSSFFAIFRPQPGELTVESIVGSQSALTASQQGVYTCRIPLQSGQMKELNVGIYPSGFETLPSITEITSVRSSSSTLLTCISTGSPATEVTWMRDGVALTIDGSTYQLTQTVIDRAESTYENVLTINAPAVVSTFTCTVANTLGSASRSVSI